MPIAFVTPVMVMDIYALKNLQLVLIVVVLETQPIRTEGCLAST
jgi:hypothetical protein